MVLLLPVLLAVVLGLALGGRLGNLAHVRIRATWLFFLALGLQVVAFPFDRLPWSTDGRVAMLLWLASYGVLMVGAALNARIPGVGVVALGMLLNVVAVVANGGTMPVAPDAMHEAGRVGVTHANSTAMTDPKLGWLVDRWAAPDWLPLANVFSVGDVVIAVGAVVLVLSAMGARSPRPLSSRDASV